MLLLVSPAPRTHASALSYSMSVHVLVSLFTNNVMCVPVDVLPTHNGFSLNFSAKKFITDSAREHFNGLTKSMISPGGCCANAVLVNRSAKASIVFRMFCLPLSCASHNRVLCPKRLVLPRKERNR